MNHTMTPGVVVSVSIFCGRGINQPITFLQYDNGDFDSVPELQNQFREYADQAENDKSITVAKFKSFVSDLIGKR